MNRLETFFGDDGLPENGAVVPDGRLKPFGGRYRFAGRTWSITVWASSWGDAEEYCKAHGLTLDGQICGAYPFEEYP